MAKYRHDRINEEMYRVAAEILRTVKDPRLNQAFVSVTGAEVSPDLKYAKIYYSHLQGDPKEIRRGLAAASRLYPRAAGKDAQSARYAGVDFLRGQVHRLRCAH